MEYRIPSFNCAAASATHCPGQGNKASALGALNIALVAEQRSSFLQNGYSEEDCAALTHEGEVRAVAGTLNKLGHHVTLVQGIQALVQHLASGDYKPWDMVFNMAQGFHGTARESQVPALLEAYRIPYTFADAATMALCQNKARTKVQCHPPPTTPLDLCIDWLTADWDLDGPATPPHPDVSIPRSPYESIIGLEPP